MTTDTAHLEAIRRLVLVFGAARTWLWIVFARDVDPATLALTALGLTATAGLGCTRRWAVPATRLAFALLLAQLAATFPLTDNHFYLETLVVGLVALAGPSGDDDALVVSGLRGLVAIVLVHTGLQKVLYGLYFQGEFLSFMIGRGGRFADALGWLLPASEVTRLASYDPLRTGAGPYRVATPLFLGLSNAIWLAEIGLGVLLLVPRTRVAAALGAIALVTAIQLGAREAGFAVLFGNLLLLFFPPMLARRVLVAELVLYAWAIGAAVGVLPGSGLIEAGYL